MMVSAILACIAATTVLGVSFRCNIGWVSIITSPATPRLYITYFNAQSVGSDKVTAFLFSDKADRDVGQMMAQLALLAKVNNMEIVIKYTDTLDPSSCYGGNACRAMVSL